MRHANAPAGPGKPIHERRDVTTEQEGLDELAADQGQTTPDPTRTARHADRNASANPGKDGAGDAASGES